MEYISLASMNLWLNLRTDPGRAVWKLAVAHAAGLFSCHVCPQEEKSPINPGYSDHMNCWDEAEDNVRLSLFLMQSFPSPRLVVLYRQNNPVCTIILPIAEGIQVYKFIFQGYWYKVTHKQPHSEFKLGSPNLFSLTTVKRVPKE